MAKGRPRKIDPDIILENAMQVFWQKGYDGTSMADIMTATKMHKGSLYQTFGDKKSLFMAALERYLDALIETQSNAIKKHQDPIDAIRAVFFEMLNYGCDTDETNNSMNKGCMAVNSLVESAPHDDDISGLLKRKHEQMIELVMHQVTQVHHMYPSRLTRTPELVMTLIGVMMEGLCIELKNNMEPAVAAQILDSQLQLLGI